VDVEAATNLGIIVVNTPEVVTDQVADHAISLLFSLVRQVSRHDRLIRAGNWDFRLAMPSRRFLGATIGFVGFLN
jgi:D-3-phosphoglycerate dehydrogenase